MRNLRKKQDYYQQLELDIEEEFVEDSATNSEYDEIIINPFDPTKIDISMRQMTLDLLIKRIKENEINLRTKFQRKEGLWDATKQSRLIESLMIRIPLPAFYFDGTDDNNWLIVDGLQRLTAIKRFVIDKTIDLNNLEFLTDYNGYEFEKLPRQLQRRIEETQVTVFIINPGTPEEVKFNIFKRINTGGLMLEPQEIRHALNQGIPAKFLEELADSEVFKNATCNLVKPDRMQDREFVLRFIAFNLTPYSKYIPDLDSFLNRAMSLLSKISISELNNLKNKFYSAMSAAIEIFENDAFRKRYRLNETRKPLNKALFEIWSVNLSKLTEKELNNLIKNKTDLKDRFIELMNNDPLFDRSITTGTGHEKHVKYRFEKIEKIIKETLR